MGTALVMKASCIPAKEEQGNAVFELKAFNQLYKTECFSFISGHASGSKAFKRRASYSVTVCLKPKNFITKAPDQSV